MKNLRKVLAMVLVVVMAFSLVTVASAATPKVEDYKDASSIKQTEAVDLLTAIGVLNGTDGNFNPTANVTREQAAKILCYTLIGAKAADALKASTSSFSDVAATRWSAGAIQYCVVKGIINGMGDGTFAPEGNVTASQFAKMLLTALGYGKNGEYTGSNWEINAIADAQSLGILSLSIDVTAPATREQIAQYAFNAYTKAAMVSYSKDISDYVKKTYTVSSTVYNYTLAYQQGVKSVSMGAVNGIASHRWTKNDIVLNGNVYADEDALVLLTNNGDTSLYNLTTIGSGFYKVSLDTGAKFYLNGTEKTGSDLTALQTTLGNTAFALAPRGYIMQFIDTDANGKADTVTVIKKTVTTLSADAYAGTNGNINVPGILSNKDKSLVIGYEGLKANDVVLSYQDAQGVYHLEKAVAVTGKLTAGNANSATFNGNFYFPSSIVGTNPLIAVVASGTNFNTDATIWLDNSGAIVKFKVGTPAAKTFAVLVGYSYNTLAETATAKIVKDDGTVASYAVAKNADGIVPSQASDFAGLSAATPVAPFGYLVSYVVDADGKITLTKEAGVSTLSAGYADKGTSMAITGLTGAYYVTPSTKVFYFENASAYDSTSNKVNVTTGYAGTKAVSSGETVTYVIAPGTTNVLSAVMFHKADTVGDTSKYLYATMWTSPTVTYTGTQATYTYSVFVDGAATTIKSTNGALFPLAGGFTLGGIYKYDTNSAGYVTSVSWDADFNGSTYNANTDRIRADINSETAVLQTSYIALEDGTTILIDANTKFYKVDTANIFVPVAAGTLAESDDYVHYTVTGVLLDKAKEVATEVYFTYSLS
jgi:hypothetical protein